MFDEAYISLIVRSWQEKGECCFFTFFFSCLDVANEPILSHIKVRKVLIFTGILL